MDLDRIRDLAAVYDRNENPSFRPGLDFLCAALEQIQAEMTLTPTSLAATDKALERLIEPVVSAETRLSDLVDQAVEASLCTTRNCTSCGALPFRRAVAELAGWAAGLPRPTLPRPASAQFPLLRAYIAIPRVAREIANQLSLVEFGAGARRSAIAFVVYDLMNSPMGDKERAEVLDRFGDAPAGWLYQRGGAL